MTFIRPAYPIDIGGLATIPSHPRPVGGLLYLDPSDVADAVKEHPEVVHYAGMVVAEIAMLAHPLTRPIALFVPGITFAAHEFGYLLWDRATDWFPSEESQASSASSYQQHGGARGTPVFNSYGSLPPGTAVHKAGWNPDTSDFFRKKGKHHCKKGYTLAKIGGAMMCIKLPRKRKNS